MNPILKAILCFARSAWVVFVRTLMIISWFPLYLLVGPYVIADALVFTGDKNKVRKEYQEAKVQVVAGQVQHPLVEFDKFTRSKVQYEYGGQKYETLYTMPRDPPLQVGDHVDILVLPGYPKSGRPRSAIRVWPWSERWYLVINGVVGSLPVWITGYIYSLLFGYAYGFAMIVLPIPMSILLLREISEKDFRNVAHLVGEPSNTRKRWNYILCLPENYGGDEYSFFESDNEFETALDKPIGYANYCTGLLLLGQP